ncbi:MAG: tetratricopeptide repeat protein [Candidatus Sumerlaeaceae bacterium]
MRRLTVLFFLMVGMTVMPAFSGNASDKATPDYDTVFAQANEAFRSKDFRRAAELYKDLVTSGVISADLYYNLGTTLAHMGKTGEAILYLEKARRLNPHDPDIVANLELIMPPGSQEAPFILEVPFLYVRDLLSFDEWFWLFTVVFVVVAVVWSWILWRAATVASVRWIWFSGAVLLVLVGSFTGWSYYSTHMRRYVVLLTEDEPILSGPSKTFSRLMTAKEGQKLPALKYPDPGWASVVLPTGQVGFVRRQAVGEI